MYLNSFPVLQDKLPSMGMAVFLSDLRYSRIFSKEREVVQWRVKSVVYRIVHASDVMCDPVTLVSAFQKQRN